MRELQDFDEYLTVGLKLSGAPPEIQQQGQRAMTRFEQLNPGTRERARDLLRPAGIRAVEQSPQFQQQKADLESPPVDPGLPELPDGAPPDKFTTTDLAVPEPTLKEHRPDYIEPRRTGDAMPQSPPTPVVDPSFQAFLRARGDELKQKLDPQTYNQLLHSGTKSPEFQDWADSLWEQEVAKAQGEHRSIERINPEVGATYRKDRGIGDALREGATQLGTVAEAFTNSAADTGALVVPGAGTLAARAVGGEEGADQYRQAKEKHPTAAFLGGIAGSFSPQNLVGLAARGVSAGASRLGSALFPKAGPALRFLGRTGTAAVSGGAAAAGQGAAEDQVQRGVYKETPEDDALVRRFIEGAATGGAAHLVGEAAGAAAGGIERSHPEIGRAREIGVGPSLTRGVVATENSQVHGLEAERQAQQTDTLAGAAARRIAPRVADTASKLNQGELDLSARETSDAYSRLGRQRPGRSADLQDSTFSQTLPPTSAEQAGVKKFENAVKKKGDFKATLSNMANTFGPYANPQPNLRSLRAQKLPPNEPVRVSTAPIVEKLMNMLEVEHINPQTGQQVPFLPSDHALQQEVQKLMNIEVVPRAQARKLPAGSGTVIMSTKTAVREGLIDPRKVQGGDNVVVIRPTDLEAPQVDAMVRSLQDKADLNSETKKGDPRYQALASAAMEARTGFGPDFEAMKAGQTERFRTGRERAEGAGLKLGENKSLPDYEHTPHNQKAALVEAVAGYRNPRRGEGAKLRDEHLRTIASAAGPEVRANLELVPRAASVDELLDKVSISEGIRGSVTQGGPRAALTGRALGAAALRGYPTLKGLGGEAAPEKALVALGAKLSPQLKDVLKKMRKSDRLTPNIGLRGGLAGARLTSGLEARRRALGDDLTREDWTNLLLLKGAADGEATP